MKRSIFAALGLLLLSAGASAQTVTAVPPLMNFQGRLTKSDGNPLADGTYTVTFRIYDAQTGGNLRWTERIGSITSRNGVFGVLLGNTTQLNANVFNGNVWLELQINDGVILLPRQRITSVAYAFKADTVPDSSITGAKIVNGTITADKLASGVLNPLAWLLGGNSITNPNTQFLGTTNNQPLALRTNNVERLRIHSDGYFTFGAISPRLGWLVNVDGVVASYSSGNPAGFAIGDPTLPVLQQDWFIGREVTVGGSNRDLKILRYNEGNFQGVVMQIQTATGNIGIGTSTPQSKLEVAGTIVGSNANADGVRGIATGSGGSGVYGRSEGGFAIWSDGNTNVTGGILVGNNVFLDVQNANNGGLDNSLRFGGASGEGIASKRTAGGNQGGLDFYTAYTNRMVITNGGRVGIGTTTPEGTLDVNGDVAFRGGFELFGNTPFLDFHPGNSAADYVVRVICGTDGVLYTVGNTYIQGTARANYVSVAPQDSGVEGGEIRLEGSPGKPTFYIDAHDNRLRVFVGGSTRMAVFDNGDLRATGDVYANGVKLTSDVRYKRNIRTLPNALEAILGLRGVSYDWDREKWADKSFADSQQIGFIAQEIEKIFPHLVSTDADGYKSVNYVGVIPVLVEAVKAQNVKIERLEKQVAEMDELKAKMAQLEAAMQKLLTNQK